MVDLFTKLPGHQYQVSLLGCQNGNPSRKMGGICSFSVFFFFSFFFFSSSFFPIFSVSGKVSPITPLLLKWCLKVCA